MSKKSRACPACKLAVNPPGSVLRQLSIKDGPREEELPCGVRDENPGKHPTTHWCAGSQDRTARGLEKPSLFEIVRVYLDYLVVTKGMVTDKTGQAVRIDLFWVVYAVLIWETNGLGGERGGSTRCPKLVHFFEEAAAINWRSTFLEEGVSIGVPLEAYRNTGVRLALRDITTHKGALLQVHCCTAHKLAQHRQPHWPILTCCVRPPSPGSMWQRSTSPTCARRSTPTMPM